ncbi:MAG TPA: hypothetical protein VKT80_10480, partial [Chloroflexota bacterium]|nr:hypothetical protein [Chloroflexota bacterium]
PFYSNEPIGDPAPCRQSLWHRAGPASTALDTEKTSAVTLFGSHPGAAVVGIDVGLSETMAG